jgi:hypothetical protein
VVKCDSYRGFQEVAILPRDAGGRGDLGGEICMVAVVGRSGDGSPEFARRTVRFQSR